MRAPRGDRHSDGAVRQRKVDPFCLDGRRAVRRFPGAGRTVARRASLRRASRGVPRAGYSLSGCALFDQFSVGQNLLLALPERIAGRARREAVAQALDSAGLSGHYASDPATLSGGERARVSLLRALLAEPRALLLDEPFSRLDKALRASFRAWVFDAVRARNIPVVLVTHDEDDIPPGGELIEISRWQ